MKFNKGYNARHTLGLDYSGPYNFIMQPDDYNGGPEAIPGDKPLSRDEILDLFSQADYGPVSWAEEEEECEEYDREDCGDIDVEKAFIESESDSPLYNYVFSIYVNGGDKETAEELQKLFSDLALYAGTDPETVIKFLKEVQEEYYEDVMIYARSFDPNYKSYQLIRGDVTEMSDKGKLSESLESIEIRVHKKLMESILDFIK